MDLLIVRHGIAEDRETFTTTGKGDAERPLTDTGRRRFRRSARGLKRLVESIDLLGTSPLVRAVETGSILQDVLGRAQIERLPQVAPTPRRTHSSAGWTSSGAEAPSPGCHSRHFAAHLCLLGEGRRGGQTWCREGVSYPVALQVVPPEPLCACCTPAPRLW
jgi:hypothetical protein